MVGEKCNHRRCRRQYVALEHGTCLHSCRVGDISSRCFTLPPWVWVIPFDLSSAHCLVTMTSDPLMSNTAKSTVMPFTCSREVDLCKYQPTSNSHLILIHKKHHVPLSRFDDVGNIMAHLRSTSFPVDLSSLSRKLIQRLLYGTLEPACLNGRFVAFDMRFSSLTSNRVILRVFDANSLIHMPQIVPVVP